MKKQPQRFDRQRSTPHRRPAPVSLVQIEKPIYGGNFLARDEGKAIFVPMVLPGEQARIRIVDDKRGYATAELEEILSPSPQRIPPRCPHFGPCGGCHYQHTGYETQLQFKQAVLRETLERGGIAPPGDIPVLAAHPWEYRNRIRLAFDAHGNPGYRGRRSHAVVSIRECPISAPLLVRSALAAAEVLRAVVPTLRPNEMALFANADETTLLLTLFVSRPAKVRFDDIAAILQQSIPEMSGAELVLETGSRQQPPRTLAKWGDTSLAYRAAGANYRVDHGAFFQVNRWLIDPLVDAATRAQNGVLAWDLFAGVGLFARKLAESFEKVIAVESAPAATDALAANLQGTTGVAQRSSTLHFLRENRNQRPDLIVVDPPRTGLGPEITALLPEIKSPSLTYVSCDPATLARDLRALLAAGYVIESVTLADLFPQTFHLETVVRLRVN